MLSLGTPGDLTSAAGGYLLSPYEPLELRLHPTDASGTSRGALYDTIAVGDYLDYQVNGIDCGNRLQVTSVGASASPRVFGLKPLSQYGGWCPSYPADPALRVDAAFLWKAEAGLSRPDGSLEMLTGAFVHALSFFAMSRVEVLWQFVVLSMIAGGPGFSMIGSPVVNVTLSKWFVPRRGWAIALGSSGISFAGPIMPITMTRIVDLVGWRDSSVSSRCSCS